MRTSYWVAAFMVAALVTAGAYYFVDIEQTQEAKLPDVDVTVEGGQAPDFDVETGSVEFGTKEKDVVVPKVGWSEEKVTVPTIDVEPAQD